MDKNLKKIIEKIQEKYKPVSIFLYGSRARTDFFEKSDYEVGVLYPADRKIARTELKELNPTDYINIYPFEYESFLKYEIDTPFPLAVYLRELIEGGKTIAGKNVLEETKPPAIKITDILQTLVFHTGLALGAVLSHRHGDILTTKIEFSKSCLFAVRCLLVLEKKIFPLTFDEIYEKAQELDLGEYADVVKHAFDVRKGAEVEEIYLYKNLSLQNKFIKKKILDAYKDQGDAVLLE